jgi:hypothetical protein
MTNEANELNHGIIDEYNNGEVVLQVYEGIVSIVSMAGFEIYPDMAAARAAYEALIEDIDDEAARQASEDAAPRRRMDLGTVTQHVYFCDDDRLGDAGVWVSLDQFQADLDELNDARFAAGSCMRVNVNDLHYHAISLDDVVNGDEGALELARDAVRAEYIWAEAKAALEAALGQYDARQAAEDDAQAGA